MEKHYSIGLDFGTNTVRAAIVDIPTGTEVGTGVLEYPHGENGVILDDSNPYLARQYPGDYMVGLEASVKKALKQAWGTSGFDSNRVIGIGVATTGSTPIPVDNNGRPLALHEEYKDNTDAMAWLWKDHTSYAEAEEITELASMERPHFLKKCGGTYSSEWYWSKLLHCSRTAPDVFKNAYTWVEMADWIPAILTGTDAPKSIKRCICAAGHKAMFNPEWGGYPGVEFFEKLNPGLAVVRQTLPDRAYNVSHAAGNLTDEWADRLGLPSGIPVAVGAFDAHLGAVGCGIAPGIMVKIMGTSGCDMVVSPLDQELPDIPGLCGIVPESIRPGCYGLEAGQSAVGDIYNWFVNYIQPGGPSKGSHEALTERAAAIKAGASGLLGLDWHNGNRTVLVDQRLTGMLVGMTLSTTPGEMYRALIESTAFGARVIMERFEEYGVEVKRIVNSGGIARKNPLVMQIHADVLGKELEVAGSSQTCALGAAIAGAVVAGRAAGGYEDFEGAIDNMTGVLDKSYTPDPQDCKVYNRLFRLYKQLHDIYGREEYEANLYHVMKDLLDISEKVRSNGNV